MEIRPANLNKISSLYKQNMNAASTKNTEIIRTSSNQDVIKISEEGLRQSEFGKTIRSIASEVFHETPVERLNSLRAAIEKGTYSISSELIAGSILSRISA